MFKRLFLLVFLAFVLGGIYGCDERSVEPQGDDFVKGQSDFVSAGRGGGGRYSEDSSMDVGSSKNEENGGTDSKRTIEEGDIVKLINNVLFVLNQYRGLQIINLENPDSPELISQVPIYGYPVEMYIRDNRAYIVVSNYFSYSWGLTGVADGNNEPFFGSIIRVVDISDLNVPKIIGGFQIEGNVTDTRIVGDVLYAVSNRYSYYYYNGNTRDNRDTTTVYSINIEDPKNIFIADRLEFERSNLSYENNVHVTTDAIFLSQYKWGYINEYGYSVESDATDITYIDISDPNGKLSIGAKYEIPGVVINRWQMDFYDGYFRVITPDRYWGNGFPNLYVFKVNSKDDIKPVSRLRIEPPKPESLTSVRFDGPRAYAVTYEQKDPLFIIDISNPQNPVQKGAIEMSGWLDYIEPRGDVLVALGHDDADGQMSLAVSMFDVKDVDNPKMISRVNFGEGWGWVSEDMNDIHKAFKVLDDINLVIIPFSYWSGKNSAYISGIQLIDYFNNANIQGLVKRGLVEHSGWVQRGIPYANEKLLTVSNEALQVVDISNRDKPVLNAQIELARNVIDFLPVDSKYGLELSNTTLYYWGRDAKSKVNLVPLSTPNTPRPYQSVELNGYFNRLYRVGSKFVAVGYNRDSNNGSYKVVIKSLSLENSLLKLIDSAEFKGNFGWYYYGCPMYEYGDADSRKGGYYYGACYGGGSVAEQLPDGTLVFSSLKYDYSYDENKYNYKYTVILKQVKVLSDGKIQVSDDFTIELPENAYTGGLSYQNMKAYITYYVPLNLNGNYYLAKAYVRVADFSNFNDIKFSKPINVPGTVIGASLSGKYIYTVDYQYYADSKDDYRTVGYLNTLFLGDEKAYLMDRIEILPVSTLNSYSYISSYIVQDEKFYYTIYSYSWDKNYENYKFSNLLKTVSLVDPEDIVPKSSISLKPQSTGTMKIISDRLFISAYDYVSGLFVYKLTDPFNPEFEAFYRTDGWTSAENVSVMDNRAFVTAGPYGVQVITLK
ncbi:MAG: beta-propeller domain-containing protein [Myxococcota bacterium]